jgi:UDP-glucose:(heptosyl)LPS alpha-1,3-glucosyltransferase
MKVIQIVRHSADGYGVSSVAANLTKELRLHGCEVEEVTLASTGLAPVCRRLTALSARLGYFAEVVLFSLVAPFEYFRHHRRDVVISHNDCIVGDIYINHGLHVALMFPENGPRRLRLFADPLHLFIAMREWIRYKIHCHRVIVNFSKAGESEHQRYVDISSYQKEIIPNGVDLTRFHPDPQRRVKARETLGIAEDDLVVIFVGNEFDRKGLPILVSAMELCPDRVRLLVVGGSNQMVERARRQAIGLGDRARFLGHQGDRLTELYLASDLLALPSRQEAWPLVLLEAMACGTPCISSAVSSTTEIVRHQQNGLLVEPTSTDVADAVRYLLERPDLREAMGDAAALDARSYGWDSIATRYQQLAESLSTEA